MWDTPTLNTLPISSPTFLFFFFFGAVSIFRCRSTSRPSLYIRDSIFFSSSPERLQGWFWLHERLLKGRKRAPCTTDDTRVVVLSQTAANVYFKGNRWKVWAFHTLVLPLNTQKWIWMPKKIHYSVGQISTDNTSDELTFLNDSFDKMATCFRDCI